MGPHVRPLTPVEVLAIGQKARGAEHPEVAISMDNLGQALAAQGKNAQAEQLLREALAVKQKALGGDHPQVALTLEFLSEPLRRSGQLRAAEQAAREALAIDTKRLGPGHPRTQEAAGSLGMALAKQARWPEAEPLLLAYAAALESTPGVERDRAEMVSQIVDMYTAWARPAQAAAWKARLAPAAAKKAP